MNSLFKILYVHTWSIFKCLLIFLIGFGGRLELDIARKKIKPVKSKYRLFDLIEIFLLNVPT